MEPRDIENPIAEEDARIQQIQDNLSPCPFCSGKAEIKQTGKLKMRIRCQKCHMGLEQKVLRFSLEWLRETLVSAWNSRAIICGDCGGSGIVVGTTAGCCGNANEDGSCCNVPIPEPIQEQCSRCESTGYLKPFTALPNSAVGH